MIGLPQSRVSTIQEYSAAQIQKRIRGILTRKQFRQLVIDRVMERRLHRAQIRISRWYRMILRKRGLSQQELECVPYFALRGLLCVYAWLLFVDSRFCCSLFISHCRVNYR